MFIYDFPFTLGHEFDGRVACQVSVQYAVDNEAAFFLDNSTSAFATTSGFATTVSNNVSSFETIHSGVGSLPGTFGSHVVHVHVLNGTPSDVSGTADSPTSLIVKGSIFCSCALPPPPDCNPSCR